MEELAGFAPSGDAADRPLEVLEGLNGGTAEFRRGFDDYNTNPPVLAHLDEGWFAETPPALALPSSEDAWPELVIIAEKHALSDVEREQLRQWFYLLKLSPGELIDTSPDDAAFLDSIPTSKEIRERLKASAAESHEARQKGLNERQIATFCQDRRAVIDRLCVLPDGITIDEDQDYLSVVVDASYFFRLLVLDATIAMRKGDSATARRSFDGAYRLLGHMQQAPGLVPLLVGIGLRQAVVEMIGQPFAAPIGSLFREPYQMSADAFESAVKSEYRFSKNLFQDAMTGSTPMEQNLLRLVLERHLENFLSIHEENPADLRPDPLAVAGDVVFRHRKCFFPEHRTAYEDGYQLAQAIAEATATITAAVAFPNATRIDTGVQSVTAAEQAIVEGWLAATAVGTGQAH